MPKFNRNQSTGKVTTFCATDTFAFSGFFFRFLSFPLCPLIWLKFLEFSTLIFEFLKPTSKSSKSYVVIMVFLRNVSG